MVTKSTQYWSVTFGRLTKQLKAGEKGMLDECDRLVAEGLAAKS